VSKLPQVGGTRLVRALQHAGFHEVHREGSHVMLAHRSDPTRIAVVPVSVRNAARDLCDRTVDGGAERPTVARAQGAAALRGARRPYDDEDAEDDGSGRRALPYST
jgi:predicted RNA binding protein YcfA (HicA-like mRNA interferase family)